MSVTYYYSIINKFIIAFLFIFAFFLLPKSLHAQGDCVYGYPRTYQTVILRDDQGRHWGQGISCIPPERQQGRIVRANVANNYLDSHANGILPSCDSGDGVGGGGYEIRTFRCPINSSMRMIFDVQPPSGYSCSNVNWSLVARDSDSGYPPGTVIMTGTGCRVSVPPPADDHATQVIVTMNQELEDPQRISYQCNTNQTVTLNWGSRAGAADYAWRLDNQGSINNPAIYDWYNSTNDQSGFTTNTSTTVPIQYDTRYQWAVTASRVAGSHSTADSWSSQFFCPGPTPTPYVNIRTRNTGGQPVNVDQMSFSFGNCPGWNICFSTPSSGGELSYYSAYGYNRNPGGAGIRLKSNQAIIGITPAPGGGSLQTRSNDGGVTVWHNYWWPSFPASSSHDVTFIIATHTPIPPTPTNTHTPTPTPFCSDSDGGNQPNTPGSTTVGWPANNSLSDSCSGSTLTEYYCSGSTRTSTTHNCQYGCSAGRCNPPPPDIVFPSPPTDPVTRNPSTGRYEIRYCNDGPGNLVGTFTIEVRNLVNGQVRNITRTNLTNGQCITDTSITCAQMGDTFGGMPCNEYSEIQVTLDINNDINEGTSGGENNNQETFVFNAVASEPFYKLRDASLHRQGLIDVGISSPLQAYDSSDNTQQFLIIGAAGVATSTDEMRVISGTGKVSNNNFRKEDYTNTIIDTGTYGYLTNLTSFREYINAQKEVKTVTAYDASQINEAGVYYRNGNLPTITSNLAAGGASTFVLFVEGNVTINTPTFGTAASSIAIISTGTISLSSSVSEVNAILIGNNIVLGNAPPGSTLKINGNLISNTYIDIPREVASNPQRPNVFIVFNPRMYLNLLPYLSDIVLEGRQVQ